MHFSLSFFLDEKRNKKVKVIRQLQFFGNVLKNGWWFSHTSLRNATEKIVYPHTGSKLITFCPTPNYQPSRTITNVCSDT